MACAVHSVSWLAAPLNPRETAGQVFCLAGEPGRGSWDSVQTKEPLWSGGGPKGHHAGCPLLSLFPYPLCPVPLLIGGHLCLLNLILVHSVIVRDSELSKTSSEDLCSQLCCMSDGRRGCYLKYVGHKPGLGRVFFIFRNFSHPRALPMQCHCVPTSLNATVTDYRRNFVFIMWKNFTRGWRKSVYS